VSKPENGTVESQQHLRRVAPKPEEPVGPAAWQRAERRNEKREPKSLKQKTRMFVFSK